MMDHVQRLASAPVLTQGAGHGPEDPSLLASPNDAQIPEFPGFRSGPGGVKAPGANAVTILCCRGFLWLKRGSTVRSWT